MTPTSLIWPDYVLALPQPRLIDFLSRKPGDKEREWRMFLGFILDARHESRAGASACEMQGSDPGFQCYRCSVLPDTTSTENMPGF